MNRIYRKVWNKELGQLVVASEFAKSDSAGVVQGEGGTAPVTRSLLAVVFASLFAVAAYGSAAFAQEWTVTDGATVGFQGDSNINVSVVADSDDATVEISLAPDLVVDSVTTGQTVMNNAGVAVGANVVLGTSGLSITGGPSVTLAGIDAGNKVITNVAAGGNASDAVNFGQLQGVESSAQAAATAASVAQSTADNALTAAGNAQTTADAAVAAAGAGWDVSADSGSTANIGSGGSVAFSGDSNISVAQSGGDNAAAIDITLNPDLNVTSVTAGNTTVNNDGLTITGGPSVTASGIDAGGTKLTGLANGTVSADSTDAITGQQLHNALFEGGSAFGVRYFHANSTADDSIAEGAESVAIGPQTVAGGESSLAAGDGATITATAEGAIALGQGAVVGTEGGDVDDGVGSIAIGRDSQASGNRTIALGDGANIDSEHIEDGTALGAGATVSGNFSTGGTAVGANAVASAGNATALGTEAQASGSGSIAVGQAEATAGNSIAAGTGAYAATGDSIALGTGAGVGTEGLPSGDRTDHIAIGTAAGQNVQGNQSTAIGYGAGQGVVGDGNIALGVEAGRSLEGNNNISIGVNANDGAGGRAQAIAIGDRTAAGSDSVALGSGAKASGSETVALGKDAIAGANGVALGAHAEAQGSNIALGRNSAARESDVSGVGYLTGETAPGNAVSVGNSNPGEAFQRRITNVSDGAQRYDAVNVGQLQSAQQSVANLVGGNVTVEANGSFGGYVIELQDLDGVSHQYATVAEAINAVSSGAISVLPGDAVIYNPNGTITVAEGVVGTDAVNVEQLNEAIAESGVKYFSANTTVDANRGNDGATADNAMAIGPAAVASGTSSLAVGHAARVNAGAHNGVAIGHDVSARAENATVLGNRSHTYDAGGVAIGQQAVSRGQNSIVMGTGAEADPKSGQTVDNAIVIGTDAEATADDGIAVGQSALASEDRAVAQGYDAHAMAIDSQAFGTRARTTGVNSQASGTDAHASGVNAIASGTNARGYANDGIAMGTGAISGFVVDIPGDAPRNHGSIAIGDTSRADDLNAMALGVEAQARAESATAIGDSAVATEDAEDGLAVGSSARVTAQNASAFGQSAEAVAEDALAVGSGARAAGQSASAVGHGAEASAANASAFGQGARALHEGSVALGSGAQTAAAVGTASYTVDKNTYNFAGTAPVATVSVGAPGQERTITNVAAGRISAQSTDAINGSQLYSTNQAVDALADDLDTAGQSVAAALGGTSTYNPATHTVTAGLSVQGNNYTNVQDALTYVGQGWNVSAEGGATANVAPGGSVDFSSDDGNIVVSRDGTNLVFDLDDEITIGESISFVDGDTFIDGDSVTTTNLTVEGETRLGDNFVVHNNGNVTYNGAEIATQDDGLSFAGNTGGNISKTLGDNTPLTISGGLGASEASTGANLRVDSDGNQLNLVMARDLTDLDSITINNGPVISNSGIDMGDTRISNLAAGVAGTDAVNVNQLEAVKAIANAGWNVLDAAGNEANIGPDGELTFVAGNENLVVGLSDDTDDAGVMEITLADNIQLSEGGSIAIGDGTDGSTLDAEGLAVVDGDNATTVGAGDISVTDGMGTTAIGGSEISVGGDNPIVISGDAGTIGGLTNTTFDPDATYTGGLAATQEQLSQVHGDLTTAGLNFVGDDGTNVHRDLGEQLSITGGATGALSEGNIGVTANAAGDGLVVELANNIELTEDGSLTIGDAELDNDGLTVVDADGNETTVGADGTAVTDVDGNRTDVGAGTITVADAAGETVIGGNQVSVGGDNPIVISGDTGTIGGLTNRTFDPDDITNGQAATEDQLGSVYEVANAGWNVSAQGENTTNVGVNSETGNSVDLNNADGNIVITKADDSNDITFDLADVLQIEESIEVGGNTFIDGDGVAVGDDVHLGDTGLVIGDADGPRFTNAGISAGDQVINDVADGVADTDAVNVRQLEANRTKYYSVNDNGVVQGNYDNDGATGVNALAAGVNTQAEGANSVAIGSGAVASSNVGSELLNPIGGNTNASTPGDFAVAIGYEARALGDQTIAVGRFAGTGAMGSNNVLLGARAGEDSETSNNIFLGERAGSGLAADPDGNEGAPFLRGHNVGVGMDTLQGGHGENNTALGLRAGRWQEGSSNTHVGSFAGVAQHGDFNVNAGYFAGQYTDSRGSVNIGVEAGAGSPDERVAADYAVSIGYQAKALADGALAVGQGAQALNGNDVALGTGSVTAAANPTSEGTVGDITYGGFAGDTPESVVSVGDVGAERQVTNVAAGRISEDSTDAINGSQLFATQTVIGNVAGSVVNVFGGNAELGDDGTITMTDIGETGENTIHDAIKTANDTANMGWHVAVGGEGASDGNNVGPGGLVDFSNDDGNIVISRDGTDLAFNLAENIDLGENGSLTTGNTVVNNDGLIVEDEDGNVNTVAADGTTVADADGNTTSIGAGTVAVTDGTGTTTIGGNAISVGGANPILISGDTGTIGGLQNQTIGYQGFADGSGRAATEEQLAQVNDTANMGWNISAQGENGTNVGPGGSVDLSNTDGNIVIAKEDDSNDVTFDLADDLVIGNSITAGDTYIDTTGVAIGADVHLGHTGLVITGGPSVTVAGIDAGNLVITNVAPGEISATSTDAINGSQLHGMGDSIVNVIGGNAELNPDGTITTSDIGGTGHDNIDDAIRAANDAANAGWTATDADGNAANIGPNGSVAFTGDGNISVAQTGEDNNGQVEITLNRDLDVDSITAGNTVIDTDGVQVGDNVHLGDTGLVIEGGPSVTTDGIDAGGSTLTNVAAGVNDTDAVNVGQLNQVAGDVNDLGDRMDVVEGDVADLQAGATGPFQVSQEAPLVPPTPTGANSAAGGSGADASGDNSTALGNQAVASGDNSTAVGQGAQATHDNSVALGQGSATTVGAQSGYDAAYVGSSDSAGEVNVGNRTITGVAPGVAGTDAVNVNQLNAGVNHAVVTANEYTDQRVNQVQSDVWHLHGRVDDLEKSINSGVATAMAMRQAPYVAGATTYFAGFGAYKDQGALGVSMRRTADNGRWSLEGGFSANRDGAGGYIGVSGVLGSK